MAGRTLVIDSSLQWNALVLNRLDLGLLIWDAVTAYQHGMASPEICEVAWDFITERWDGLRDGDRDFLFTRQGGRLVLERATPVATPVTLRGIARDASAATVVDVDGGLDLENMEWECYS